MPSWKQILAFICIIVAILLFIFSKVIIIVSIDNPILRGITMLVAMVLLLIIGIRDIRSDK